MTASRMPSEIWSAILSGWPSVTDSDVNRNSLSLRALIEAGKSSVPARRPVVAGWSPGGRGSGVDGVRQFAVHLGRRGTPPALPPPLAALDEIDDQRDPLEPEARAQPVLEVVRVVAGDSRARVDLDREPGGRCPGLDHEQQF